MKIKKTEIEGVCIIELEPKGDKRGKLTRLYCDRELEEINKDKIVQINHTLTSRKGSIRGIHYQLPPDSEDKFITCMRGKIFDVCVDLRNKSPTFLKWFGVELSDKNNKMIMIPKGCAHGFQVLEDDSELLYMHTAHYNKGNEAGLRFDDPALAIDWPLDPTDISERDKNHPSVDVSFKGVDL